MKGLRSQREVVALVSVTPEGSGDLLEILLDPTGHYWRPYWILLDPAADPPTSFSFPQQQFHTSRLEVGSCCWVEDVCQEQHQSHRVEVQVRLAPPLTPPLPYFHSCP